MQRMSKQCQVLTVSEGTDPLENYSFLPKGIDVYEISGPFFFGAAKKYRETLRGLADSHRVKVLVIRMRHVPFMDSTGINNFSAVIDEIHAVNVTIVLSGVNESVRSELERSGLADKLNKLNICSNFDIAKERAKEVLNEINEKEKTK